MKFKLSAFNKFINEPRPKPEEPEQEIEVAISQGDTTTTQGTCTIYLRPKNEPAIPIAKLEGGSLALLSLTILAQERLRLRGINIDFFDGKAFINHYHRHMDF